MSVVCDHVGITLNKNTVPGDKNALVPGGILIGTPALTTRGLLEQDFEQVAEFLHQAVQLTLRIDSSIPIGLSKKLRDFRLALKQFQVELNALREQIIDFASKFPIPGKSL